MAESGDSAEAPGLSGDPVHCQRLLLQQAYADLDLAALSDAKELLILPVPSVDMNKRNFEEEGFFAYIGRSFFPQLIKFLEDLMQPSEHKFKLKLSEDNRKRVRLYGQHGGLRGQSAFVIGTPGEGKSFAVAVAAGYLLVKANYRVIYVSALCLISDFNGVLMRALLLAFNDVSSINEAESDPGGWLRKQAKALVIVDDVNELDDVRTRGWPEQRMQVKAYLLALSGSHVVVHCGSCSSEIRLPLTRTTHDPYFVIAGGFNKEELGTFLDAYEFGPSKDSDECKRLLEKTGTNPRLLRYHFEGRLEEELQALETRLKTFICGLDSVKYSEFVRQLAGDLAPRLPDAMDSRCFYVCEDEKQLSAICDCLRSVANSGLIRDQVARSRILESHIDSFVTVVNLDGGKNMIRNGWNVEEAVLLVLGTQQVSIGLTDSTWHFKAETVKGFPKGLESATLDGTRSVLHCPYRFNCEAVDALIEGPVNGKMAVAGVQVSVDRDPQESHDESIKRFLQAVHDKDYDIFVFIWVGHFPGGFQGQEIRVEFVEGQWKKVIEVTLSFSQVHRMLNPIDAVLRNVRERQLQEERVYCGAKTQEGNRCTLTLKKSAGGLCHVHSGKRGRDLVKRTETEEAIVNLRARKRRERNETVRQDINRMLGTWELQLETVRKNRWRTLSPFGLRM